MASTQSHVISSEGLLRFRLYYFVRKWGKDVMFQIFYCCFLENCHQTISEILTDNGVTLGRRSLFNRQEIDNLSNNAPESLDITALNKILQFLWGKGVNDPGDRLKELMKKIKDERNCVSHEESNISQTELNNKLQEFGRMLEEALDKAALLYSCHSNEFNQMKTDIGEAIPKIQDKIRERYDPSNVEDIKRLQDEIEEFGDQLRDYIREKSVKQSIPFYKDICKILPFDWLCQYGIIDPSTITVPLKMDTETEFQGSNPTQKCVILDQSEILDKKNPRGNDPVILIISGDAGSGKTTLLCSLVEKWHKEETDDIPSLSTFQIILHMEFRKHDHDNFDDYLRDFLQNMVAEFGFDLVKSSILLSKCLILCDGYDERNIKSSKLFEEMLELKINAMKIIVTTRPVNTKELTCVVNQSKKERLNLTLLGLQENEMKYLVTRLINHHVQDVNERDDMVEKISSTYQSMTPEMKKILKNPLQFNLFILLYVECPDLRKSLNTVTNLFLKLNEHKFKRLKKKLGIKGDDAISEIEASYRDWSLRYYLQRKYELSEEDVNVFKEKCLELGLDFDLVMSTCFNTKHSRKGLEIMKIYCYRHRTEQEFAAVAAICDMIVKFHKEESSKFNNLKRKRRNVIDYVLTSVRYGKGIENNCMEKTFAKEESQSDTWHRRFLSHVTGFFTKEQKSQPTCMEHFSDSMKLFTGILFNTEKDLLYLVLDDILLYWGGDEYDDIALQHLLETNNDDKVADAVARLIGNKSDKELSISKRENFSSVPSLLARIRPSMVSFLVDDTLDDPPHLNEALQAAVQNDIELAIFFEYRDYPSLLTRGANNDKYLAAAKTCVEFRGTLSANGLQSIPTCMKRLNLFLDIENIKYLSTRLPDIRQLQSLELVIWDDGSVNRDNLSSLPYSGNKFKINLVTNLDDGRNYTVEETSKLLNGIWPKQRSEADLTRLWLFKTPNCEYTGDEIELLLNSLKIRPLNGISIGDATIDAKERRDELKALCCSRGLGNLWL